MTPARPVVRQDPTTREWSIIAPARARRPHEVPAEPPALGRGSACPFCPGNEALTPPELLRVPDGAGGWAVRVVPNRFPALAPDGQAARRALHPFFREIDGVGHHEVIVETPDHDRAPAAMEVPELRRVLEVYQARARVAAADPRVQYVVVFKNHGPRAGTSLAHPHAQLIATPVAPSALRRAFEVAVEYYDTTGRSLYADLVEAELAAGARVVLATERFVVFEPWAPRTAFETWIVPRRPEPSFLRASGEDLAALAPVLRATLRALAGALGPHDFNLVVHTAPVADEARPYYGWHLRILPRLTAIAGFELGSGIAIVTAFPEEAAARLRRALEGAAAPA